MSAENTPILPTQTQPTSLGIKSQSAGAEGLLNSRPSGKRLGKKLEKAAVTGQRSKKSNRERILEASIELFNREGVVAMTTNHIADHLSISPGNLYFHFRNKEEIIYELFKRMRDETYSVWARSHVLRTPKARSTKGAISAHIPEPLQLIRENLELFWKYRFFHREMYHMRRRDLKLAKLWRSHIDKTNRLLKAAYLMWVRAGTMRLIHDSREMQMLADTVLITSSACMRFFESPEKPATHLPVDYGVEHLMIFLWPYYTDEYKKSLSTASWKASGSIIRS